jgi:hypothetical protein
MTAVPATLTAVPGHLQPVQEAVPYQTALVPSSMREAMDLAALMAKARMVPAHLQNSPSDCLMCVMQARRWNMDPFAVAQASAVVRGKMCYEGKLVAAVVNTSPMVHGRLAYRYEGEGDNRTIHVSGTPVGEAEVLTVSVRLKDARTSNDIWQKQPDQQLAYHGARVWARRYVPELLLGTYAPEEIEVRPSLDRVEADVGELTAPPREPPPIEVKMPGDDTGSVFFPRTKPGLEQALTFIQAEGAGVVLVNSELLNNIADNRKKMPDLAARVDAIRKAAREALTTDEEQADWPGADAGAEAPQIDREAERMAVHRGDKPADMTDEEAAGLPPA